MYSIGQNKIIKTKETGRKNNNIHVLISISFPFSLFFFIKCGCYRNAQRYGEKLLNNFSFSPI